MKNMLIGLLLAFFAGGSTSAPAAEANDFKYGFYIHYGMDTFRHAGEAGQLPVERFAPASVNVQAWVHTAKAAGMTFAVLTAKHTSGFCLWNSQETDYDLSHSSYKGDIIGDFIAACQAEGILPGVHYSISDTYFEGGIRYRAPVSHPFFEAIKKQLTELHTKYPGIKVQVIDDDGPRLSPAQYRELCQLIQQLNPQCVIFDHAYEPHHISASIIKGWNWKAGAELIQAPQLFEHYEQSRTTGRPFLLNAGPLPSGDIPEEQLAILKQLTDLIANPPPTPPANGAPEAKPDIGERLKTLKSLYDQGVINQDDYDKKVKSIMDSI